MDVLSTIDTPGLLFRFDVAGAGASLKRYSDPSFFKMGQTSSMIETDYFREKNPRKVKASNTFSILANTSHIFAKKSSLCASYFTKCLYAKCAGNSYFLYKLI
jgi:hypothetical protein